MQIYQHFSKYHESKAEIRLLYYIKPHNNRLRKVKIKQKWANDSEKIGIYLVFSDFCLNFTASFHLSNDYFL